VEASRRQLGLLGAILVVLAGVVYWESARPAVTPEEFSAAARQNAPGGAGEPGAQAGARPRAPAPAPIPAVALASLDVAQPEPADSGRDPFRFESGAAIAPRSGTPGTGAATSPPAGAVTPAVPLGPPPPPPPPPIPLKFIGIAKQGAGRLYAVLRDERGVYYGAEGDVVEGRYRILRVSADTIEVSYVDGRGRTSIPLSGGRP